MGDVIGWSKIGKLKKAFDDWKAPWTSTRAGKLDKVDAIANDTHSVWNSIPSGTDSVAKQTTLNTVNSNVSTLVQNMGVVKSVQRGINAKVSSSKPITISHVDSSKSLLIFNGSNSGSANQEYAKYLKLTDDQITFATGVHGEFYFSWQVIEFY